MKRLDCRVFAAMVLVAGSVRARSDDESRNVAPLRSRHAWKERLAVDDRAQRLRFANRLCTAGPEAAPAMIDALSHDDPAVRFWAVIALTTLGEAAAPADAELFRTMTEDPSSIVRSRAAFALASMDRHVEQSIRTLSAELSAGPHPAPRILAAELLGKLGPKALPAVATLQHAARDEDNYVRRLATAALTNLHGRSKGR